jgi:CPA2 family monovalent cation:H+ antiporter-2
MLLTPPVLALGGKLAALLPQRALPLAATSDPSQGAATEPLKDHVVIAGYGVNGQNLARALTAAGVRFAILEMNPETVRAARSRGEPIHYGDCTRAAVLSTVGIERARLYVVAISDAASTRQSVVVARNENPDLYIMVRTRFVAEIDELRKLGADDVVPEEFETSVELFARVLSRFEVPRNLILELVSRVRGDMYEMLRGPTPVRNSIGTGLEALGDIRADRLLVRAGSPAVGQSLAELEVRAKTGALVLAVQRGPTAHANPDADFRFAPGDVLLVMGTQSALDAALSLIDPTAPVV